MKIELRDDQLLLIEQLIQNIHDDSLIVSPSGSGKSYLIVYLDEMLTEQGYAVNIYAPTIEVRQQIDDLLEFNGSKNRVKGVISDINAGIGNPDYLLIDEAHHSEAETYQRLFDKYPNAVKIGFSATPKRLDGKGLDNTYNHIIVGKQVKELVDEHILSDFAYFAPSTSKVIRNGIKSDYLTIASADFYIATRKDSAYKKAIYGDVVKTWVENGENKLTVLFAPNIEMSQKFTKEFQKNGINAVHIDGLTNIKERKEIIEQFRNGDIQILCNVDLISEGFDMSDADCVILTRPTESLAMFMQQAFRGLRYREGKKAIILDHADNISLHGALDQPREWKLEGADRRGSKELSGSVWEMWNSDAVFDTSVELKEVIKDYDSRFDKLIEKSLKLRNMDGFKLLVEIQREANIMSISGYSWAYVFALKYNFDIPRLVEL